MRESPNDTPAIFLVLLSGPEQARFGTTETKTMSRTITEHHDGHGLNESIVITTDTPDQSGAAHRYNFHIERPDVDGYQVAYLQFQQGPRNVVGSTAGVTEAAVLAVLIDRLRGFQSGPYSCRENAIQLTKLEEVLHWTKARADERARRGVLGKNAK